MDTWVSKWRQHKQKVSSIFFLFILFLLSNVSLGIINSSFLASYHQDGDNVSSLDPLLGNKTTQMESVDRTSPGSILKSVESAQGDGSGLISPTIFIYSTDATGSYYNDKWDNEAKLLLESLGFNVLVEDRSTIPVLNSSHFVNISQFWLMNGGDGSPLTKNEQDQILNAWRNSINLVLAGDQTSWYSNVNLIGEKFGVEYEGEYLFSNPQTPNFINHPIWINVSTIYSDPTLPQLIIDPSSSAQALSVDSGYIQHALLENKTGSIFWGSSFGNFMDEHITKFNNSQYISNLARYLQKPEIYLLGAENNSEINEENVLQLQIIDENLKNVKYNWDGGTNLSITEPYDITLPLSDGWHDLNIYVQDCWNHSLNLVYSLNRRMRVHSDPDWSIWYDENVNAHSVFIEDNYAFVAAYNDGLVIINVTDPSNPGSAIYQSTRGTAYDVFVKDGFAYLAEAYIDGSTGGLTVVDVRDPDNPTIHGTYDWFPRVDRLFVNDNHVYLGDDEQGMLILNISDPSTPTFDSTVSSIGTGDIFIYNNFAYTTQTSPWNVSEDSLAIINITNSKNPGDPIYVNITGKGGNLFVNNSFAYINAQALGGALAIVNVTNPLNPGDPQFFNLNGYPTYIDGYGSYIYVTNNEYGTNFRLRVINVTDPQNPSSSSYYDLDGIIPLPPSEGICIDGDFLYIAHYHGLIAIDLIAAFDVFAPDITLINPNNSTYFRDNVWLNISVNELTSWVGYSLDGKENVTLTLENTLLDAIQPGTHTLQVFANDTAGNMGNSEVVTFTLFREQIILEDDFEDLDRWEITNPSIMTLNTTFGNLEPSVEIVSTQVELGLCKVEEVYFPPLESGEFIRTAIDLYIPAIQTGSISIFTGVTDEVFPFRLQVNNTNSVEFHIYSTGQELTIPYNFEPQNWYKFAVDIYGDHISLTIDKNHLTSLAATYQSKGVTIAFGDGAGSIPEQGHYFFDNIKVSKFAPTSPEKEQVIFKDIFDNLDNWELTVPSIFTFNTSFGNPAPSVGINSTVSGYGLCKHEEVFLPPLETGEFIRASIDLFIPEIQVGSISVFTDLTGVKFPFQLRVYDTANVRLYIYSGGLSSTVPYEFEPSNWYQFVVDIYSEHYSLKVNGSHLTTIYSSSYQSGLVPIAFGDGSSSYEQGYYYFDNVKVSKFTDYEIRQVNPITINGDTDFVDQGWLGSGTFQAPYLITNLEINGSGGHCIQIHNTRAYFVISDCILYGATSARMAGIFLGNVSNGYIVNNICSGKDDKNKNYAGIWLESANDITITNNTCQNDDYGIILWDLFGSVSNADNSIISNNCTKNDHGIALYSSNDNLISDNFCQNNTGNGGIYLENSDGNVIVNNTCFYNDIGGINFVHSDSNELINNSCEKNQHGIVLSTSDSNTLINNNCSSNIYFGLYVSSGYSNTIQRSLCNYNGEIGVSDIHGIFLLNSNNNQITRNECIGNTDTGILLMNSSHNTINNNTCSLNSFAGIYLRAEPPECVFNSINWNTFEINGVLNALNNGKNNSFDSNYWSDYSGTDLNEDGVGDTPYFVHGVFDQHPRGNFQPLIRLKTPSNNTIVSKNTLISLTIKDDSLELVWYNWDNLNDQTLNPPFILSVPQTNGWHWLYIFANDSFSSQNHHKYLFYIDMIPPVISLIGLDNNTVVDIREGVTLNVSDVSLDFVWYNWDFGNNFSLSFPFHLSVPLLEGEHWLIVFANDSFGYITVNSFHFWANYWPTIVLSSHRNMSLIFPETVLKFEINDSNLVSAWYQWDSGVTFTLNSSFLVIALDSLGWHTLLIYAIDIWGSVANQQYSFYIIGSPAVNIIQTPSTVYSEEKFIYSFTITNSESISLNLTLLVFSFDDEVLYGNGSQISLAPRESRNIQLEFKPKHASIHQVEICLYLGELLYYQIILEFDVKPQWQSPRFYIPFSFLLFSIILLILSFVGVLSYYSWTRIERTQPFMIEEFKPITSPSLLDRIQIFFKARVLYKRARGTLHLQTLKICLKNMKKYVGAQEKQKNQLISNLKYAEHQEQRALEEELSQYLIRERLIEAEGIGSILQSRIVQSGRFRHINDLHRAIRHIYGIGDVKQEGISRWVRNYKRQFPDLLRGHFPGKNHIVNSFRTQKGEIQGRITAIDLDIERTHRLTHTVNRELNWLQQIKSKHFRATLRGNLGAKERVRLYLTGICRELIPPPEWFNETVQKFGKSQYNKILKSQYRGFLSTEKWEHARDKGFIDKVEYDKIRNKGFKNKFDYDSAIQLGFSNASDFYTSYAVVKEKIIDKEKLTDKVTQSITRTHTPVKISDLNRELNLTVEIIISIVQKVLSKGIISGKIIENVYYPDEFIDQISSNISNRETGTLSSIFSEFKINQTILELAIENLLKSDKSIFTLYLNPDQDIFVIIFNSEWNNVVRELSSPEGFTPGTIFPELTIYNWRSIFENQKLVTLSYRDQLFTLEGLQAYTPDNLDEIDHIIKNIRRQLPQLPLSSQDQREILHAFEQLIPVEPVLLPYFCQMDSAMIVKEQAAYVCVECNRKICPTCYNAMRQTGMTTCIHCNGNLVDHPALQIEIDIERVDQMSGHDFENFLEGLFRTRLYRIENIQSSGDHGVDLVVVKGESRTGVQAKRYKPDSKIGNKVLVTLKGGGYFHDCDKLMVVTTSFFTPKAKEYAQKVGIELWDRDVLRRYLTKYNEHLQDISK